MNREQLKNFIALFNAQLFTFPIAPLVIFSAGLIGDKLIDVKGLVTLPIATQVLGTAAFAYPLTRIMDRYGRKGGFVTANLIALAGVGMVFLALTLQHFWLFCLATFMLGMNMAAMQQFRFSVVEGVTPALHNRLISLLILSGLLGAILALQLINRVKDYFEIEFLGSYGLLGLSLLLALISLLTYKNQSAHQPNTPRKSSVTSKNELFEKDTSSSAEVKGGGLKSDSLFLNPRFNFSFSNAMLGYVCMSFVMTATPIYAKNYLNFSLEDTSTIIQSHIAAMFLPSIFTGILLDRLGIKNMIRLGIVFFFISATFNVISYSYHSILTGLIFLGVAWNFMFIAATVYLTRNFQGEEKFKAQGLNELMVFGGQALAAILSGWYLHYFGWDQLNLLFTPFIALLLIFSFSKKV